SAESSRKTRPAPRGTASYQRRRAVKACQVCRARRTKCDNLKPSCSFCLKVGATCIQSPVDLSSFDPASLKILEWLDDLEDLMRSTSLSSGEASNKTRVVQISGPRFDAAPSEPTALSMVLPPSMEEIMSWACFQGLIADDPDSSDISPCQQSHVGISAQSPVSALGAVDLEPLRVRHLLDNFFNYVHVKNPILDESATRKVVDSTVLNGVDWSPESCLSLLICALGSIATPFEPSHATMPGTAAYTSAQSFFQAAQKRIGTLLSSNDIISPQCLFLSGVFMMCNFQPRKAWRYFIQSLAHCQQLSFLSPRAQQLYCEDAQDHPFDSLHQAVYWSAWKSERELREHIHLPDFSPNDHGANIYPTFFPTPPAPRADGGVPMNADSEREQTSWYFYLAEISLRRLAARIGDEMEGLQKTHISRQTFLQAAASAVSLYEAQAQEWIASLPPVLSFDAPVEEDDVCRFVLRGHAINLFEMIYWPFLSAYLDDSGLDPFLLSLYADLAQRALAHHHLRLIVNKPGFQHRHHGTHPLMSSCSRSALILGAAAISNRRPLDAVQPRVGRPLTMPPGWSEAVNDVIGLLDFWSNDTKDFDKIRHLL
ncbi:hypothetical protein K469DRAFT_517383, partial [Zopfia rhizophila CBS 207.26]